MYKYRISKYNPKYRDRNDCYLKDEWTSCSDIGKEYDGKVFEKEDYLAKETQYCNTILTILKSCKIKEMIVEELEICYSIEELQKKFHSIDLDFSNSDEKVINSIKNNQTVTLEELKEYFKLALRECFWCKFTDEISQTQVEFGYDYYVYIYIVIVL